MEYEIIKRLGILEGKPEGFHTEVNIISWDGNPPKLDIRKWNADRMNRGISLSAEGMEKLQEILKDVTL